MTALLIPLGAIALATLLAAMSPGPNMVAVISATVTGGKSLGLLTGFGIVAGGTCWAIAALIGLASLFEYFPNVALALRGVGAAYLVWLGLKSLQSTRQKSSFQVAQSPTQLSPRKAFRVGFTISITNPKALLFFGSVLTALVPPAAPFWWSAAALVVMMGIAMSIHTITATLFSRPSVMARYLKGKKAISATFGILFVSFGGKIALETYKQFRAQ